MNAFTDGNGKIRTAWKEITNVRTNRGKVRGKERGMG